MARLRIADLLAASPIDLTVDLDEARVASYVGRFEALPPVVVFDTPQGLLLVDGRHRVAAARRRGADFVEAEIHRGSRHDALRYAAEKVAAERGISVEQAMMHALGRRKPET